LEVGQPIDQTTVEQLWDFWLDDVLVPGVGVTYDREQDRPFIRAVAAYPGTRLRLARDQDGRPVGYSLILPLCRGSLEVLDRAPPWWGALVHARWTSDELARLPDRADTARAFYIVQVICTATHQVAALAALLRDVFSLFALGGIYLCTTRLPTYKSLLEACGFEIVPAVAGSPWGGHHAADGFVLDLTRSGFEPWIEAIMAGRRPPKLPASTELPSGEVRPEPSLATLAQFGLSRRESEVLLWVAQGKTDREIADILVNSPHTVHKHLQNIYRKLGVRSRTAALAKLRGA
jgi:DNA-binding CsgD family transcriptional regulator